MIGDPTEGALVVLAGKGGLDAESTRREFPRVAELPFDTAYKLMATFHRMKDESGRDVVRAFVKGAPDQLLDRSTQRLDPDLEPQSVDDDFRGRYLDENQRLAAQGLRVLATARKDFEPDDFDPNGDLLELMDDLTVLTLVGIVDPPRPAAKASIATRQGGGDPGTHDHRRPRDHGRGDRAQARDRGPRDHGRGVRGDERRPARERDRRHRRDRARHARGQGPPGRHAQEEGADRRHDRRRRQRRSGAQAGRHRHRHGDHRHRGLEGGRRDDPDRRQLLDDRQGRRARTRALRQPDQVHPLPDGRPRRHGADVPQREHLQHRRRRPVPPAADAVAELHHAGVPGDRPRLRQAERGTDETQAACRRTNRFSRAR